jgi:hypothetical protein
MQQDTGLAKAFNSKEKEHYSNLFIWVNYSKPTYGLARFSIAYPWFKTCHFIHLRFKTLAVVTQSNLSN